MSFTPPVVQVDLPIDIDTIPVLPPIEGQETKLPVIKPDGLLHRANAAFMSPIPRSKPLKMSAPNNSDESDPNESDLDDMEENHTYVSKVSADALRLPVVTFDHSAVMKRRGISARRAKIQAIDNCLAKKSFVRIRFSMPELENLMSNRADSLASHTFNAARREGNTFETAMQKANRKLTEEQNYGKRMVRESKSMMEECNAEANLAYCKFYMERAIDHAELEGEKRKKSKKSTD